MSVLRLALGDLKRFAKDWQAALWLIAMPLVFAYIFGSAMRGGGPQATWIPVIDLDQSGLSALFVEQLRQPEYWIEMKGAETQDQLKTKWPYGIVIPAGFGQGILTGKPVKATLVRGQAAPDKILEVQSCLAHAIVRYTKGLIVADISGRTWNDNTKAALEDALKRPQLLTLSRMSARTLKPPPTGFHQSLPGMLVMFVLQMIVTYGGVSLVHDRVGGRLPRLFASPLSRFEVYSGKVLARVLLGILQAAVLLVGGSLLFRIPLGDHPLFLAPVVVALALFAGLAQRARGPGLPNGKAGHPDRYLQRHDSQRVGRVLVADRDSARRLQEHRRLHSELLGRPRAAKHPLFWKVLAGAHLGMPDPAWIRGCVRPHRRADLEAAVALASEGPRSNRKRQSGFRCQVNVLPASTSFSFSWIPQWNNKATKTQRLETKQFMAFHQSWKPSLPGV